MKPFVTMLYAMTDQKSAAGVCGNRQAIGIGTVEELTVFVLERHQVKAAAAKNHREIRRPEVGIDSGIDERNAAILERKTQLA